MTAVCGLKRWGKKIMKPFWTIVLLLLVGCASMAPTDDVLTALQARQALVDFVTAHPEVFVSPGRAESATDLLKSPVSNQSTGHVKISWFNVDLDKKIYQRFHGFGKPGSGWFENWMWNGSFSKTPEGKWKVDQPEFTKDWGD